MRVFSNFCLADPPSVLNAAGIRWVRLPVFPMASSMGAWEKTT